MNKTIGGYFSLELPQNEEYHKNAIRLNTGRNCLEYILRCHNYRKIFIPYYTCKSILEPFAKTGIEYVFYHINDNFEITDNISLRKDEALLYTNYFGLKQKYISSLYLKHGKQLIIDNTQAFFESPLKGINTFYSCRKFFGVPDGAYLYPEKHLKIHLETDISYDRSTHLIKSIDISQEKAFDDFHEDEKHLSQQDIKTMSRFTQRIMQSINYKSTANSRRENFLELHHHLQSTNLLNIDLTSSATPLIYPFFTDDLKLREHLINNKIFVAKYWPNVLEWTDKHSIEYSLAEKMIPLPIDQRYTRKDMNFIIKTINR